MVTETPPRGRLKQAEFERSDRMNDLDLPPAEPCRTLAAAIETAMLEDDRHLVSLACRAFLAELSRYYCVSVPPITVLEARPLRHYEWGGSVELFGDYHPKTRAIRVWMRTAVRQKVTSYGTFLSTLCHEFCHHLDYEKFRFRDSYHTRGFYERVAALYHHARNTPRKPLVWAPLGSDRWRIDWRRTRLGSPSA
jgi:hypothetical protein